QIFNKAVPIVVTADSDSPLRTNITDTKSITLQYDQSVFSFEFASLNYTTDDKKQYAYMLKGFDKDWNYVDKRTATYTNLNPGHYTFMVKGLTNEGDWSEKMASVNVYIEPPFWGTYWFRSLVVLAVLSVVLAVYRIRERVIVT